MLMSKPVQNVNSLSGDGDGGGGGGGGGVVGGGGSHSYDSA